MAAFNKPRQPEKRPPFETGRGPEGSNGNKGFFATMRVILKTVALPLKAAAVLAFYAGVAAVAAIIIGLIRIQVLGWGEPGLNAGDLVLGCYFALSHAAFQWWINRRG
jgi:hypothetical protein